MTDPPASEPTTPDSRKPDSRNPDPTTPARRAPLARWIRRLPRWAYISLILAAVVALLLIAALVNPGERVGPVQHARPPVGGPTLPATRL